MLQKQLLRTYVQSVQKINPSNRVIDMRSDTVTRPCHKMKAVMQTCALGDDVFCDDPTVIYMQEQIAKYFGKEAALYMPSGTQSNLVAMMVSCKQKGDSAMIGSKSHIANYERGGVSAIGSIFPTIVRNLPDGTFDLKEL
jgi:threonine aldolase